MLPVIFNGFTEMDTAGRKANKEAKQFTADNCTGAVTKLKIASSYIKFNSALKSLGKMFNIDIPISKGETNED